MEDLLIIPVILVIALIAIGLIFAKLYQRSTKEVSFVRTGLGGQKVIMNGGALVLPIVHDTIPVNMNTVCLRVERAKEQALITRDRMRVDVTAEFYIRVSPNEEAIATAAQTLGHRTMHTDRILELIEGKFVDALRAVAAKMAMEELHEQRVNFVQEVQVGVSEDLQQNGLELETVSLTALDQTDIEYFNPQNAFDAEGLTKLTESIVVRKKRRNDIEQDTQVAIQTKNLEAERKKLELSRDTEYAKLGQQREVESYRAGQSAEIAKQQAEQERAAQEAKIVAQRQVEQAEIQKRQAIEEREIAQRKAVESAEIERKQAIELAEQERAIAIANKSKEESEAKAAADIARAEAAKAEESVITARQVAQADRQKQIELIEAHKKAERDAIGITIAATTEKQAAQDHAEAKRLQATGEAESRKITAQAEAEAIKIRAEADEQRYLVDAEGKRQLNESANILSAAQIEMQIKLKTIEQLPAIIAQTVKPMERIEGIKIYQIEGLAGGHHANSSETGTPNLAEQVTNAALRYRLQTPLLDGLLRELGFDLEQGINGMSANIAPKIDQPAATLNQVDNAAVTKEMS
ncbi:MAG: flotillin family protein [Thioploca sp.]|nr:flotillin family protein [Thioploca sp.]